MAISPDPPPQVPSLALSLSVPLVAAALATAVAATGSNEALLHIVNAWPAVTGDALWSNLSVLGEGAAALALTGWLVGRHPRMLLAGVLAGLAVTVVLHPIKDLVGAPRPAELLGSGTLHVIGDTLNKRSFPSGHASTVFAAAALACTLWRRPAARLAALAVASLVAASRLAVGAHWPLDVLAGAALGWACASAALHLAARLRQPGRTLQLWLALVPVLACAYVAYPGDESGAYEIARPLLAVAGLWGAAVGVARVLRSQAAAPSVP